MKKFKILLVLVMVLSFVFVASCDNNKHEHEYVDGKCECGEKDPNYVEPETPAFGVVTEFKENVAYKFGLLQGNTGKTIFVTGNYKNTYYGESTEDVAAAADVYVVAVAGGYNLKLVKADGTVLYICQYDDD